MTAVCKRPERGEALFERPAGKAAAAQETWGGANILEAAVGGRAGELDRPRLDYLSPMVVSEMVEVRCPLVVGVRERLEPCSYLGGPGVPGGSPMVSPRSSPRHSPRSSPRVSPRASPRASPRVSPRSTPRRRSRAHSRDVTPLEELVVVSVPCRELKPHRLRQHRNSQRVSKVSADCRTTVVRQWRDLIVRLRNVSFVDMVNGGLLKNEIVNGFNVS
ncbi:uncharacterized protein LOC119591828 [Penaeus monodon]|uniref:uncharacterized protein LOC119591828 n=1 Tax=Penaeus monodon TaxID=6687 RepID=UPI0018A7C05C|nr:uncharacterized protein LOC119591828 [Penaeus monodon]